MWKIHVPLVFEPNVLPPKGFDGAVLLPKPVLLVLEPKPEGKEDLR